MLLQIEKVSDVALAHNRNCGDKKVATSTRMKRILVKAAIASARMQANPKFCVVTNATAEFS